jgi:DEAD/DEAH box helicase domain-containing protein
MNYITFDLETYSPSNLNRIDTSEFRVSVLGAYISWENKYLAFLEKDMGVFIDLLKDCDLVVGYNHCWFDLPVLQKYANFNLKSLPTYDIMLEVEKKIGFKVKLDDLCKATLGKQKTDHYETFKHYYADKNWLPLIDYCMHDVLLTEKLFELARAGLPLKYEDLLTTKEIIVDKPVAGQMQTAVEEMMVDSIF